MKHGLSDFLLPNCCQQSGVDWLHVVESMGTIASFFPNGVSSLIMVSTVGLLTPFSIRAIAGCLTPLISSSAR